MFNSHKNTNFRQRKMMCMYITTFNAEAAVYCEMQPNKQLDKDESCILGSFMPGLRCLVRTNTAEPTASLGNPQWTQI